MLKPTLAGFPEEQVRGPSALGIGSTALSPDRQFAVHSSAEQHLRRVRYFADLMETGYRHALQPDPFPRSLRTERIALGIDLPELDTVPLWSARRSDGAVSIAFVEFIVEEICKTLEALFSEMGPLDPAAAERLMEDCRALRRVQESASAGGGRAPSLPRLGDIFLSQGLLEEVCGQEGLLAVMVRRCEEFVGRELSGARN